MDEQPNNLLHGKTLQFILQYLVDYYGWDGMYSRIQVKCFHNDPSIKSSLKFLRRTEWARRKVEGLYLQLIGELDIRP
ncbi:MAG: VF530 family DNA-binding protein [Rectinemataceae bacterium]